MVGVRVAVAFVLTLVGTAAAGLPGEDPLAVKDAIGRGVHAFYGGNFDDAYHEFTNAIKAGTDDPRAFYFRGLAALRLGRTAEAEADFASGADREAAGGSTKRVSRSLERVQGSDRLTLERYRLRARLASLLLDRQNAARRYSTIEDPAGDLRRRRRPEEVDTELLSPRQADGAEEVPAPRPKPGKAGQDGEQPMEEDDPAGEPKPKDSDDDTEKDETEMAADTDEEKADKNSQ